MKLEEEIPLVWRRATIFITLFGQLLSVPPSINISLFYPYKFIIKYLHFWSFFLFIWFSFSCCMWCLRWGWGVCVWYLGGRELKKCDA